MRLFARIIAAIIVNGIALYAAAHFVEGFSLATEDLRGAAIVAGTLTVLNFILKPLLKMVLGPVILLTLGLGLVLVNSLVLWTLDFLSPELTIQSIPALFGATLIIGLINFIFHLAQRN